ncbi:MAG: VOC family protein [Hoeflea sp.]|uniref:VOC family protein n=1 Tax=Hoeflea sp. TaxID=1940281 RepID=UPI00272F9AA0|nr:VOC family protein [Hoeflea sp.]MDP2118358.1 VOC family protein [Hoeflea sp.]MDP3525403.1 VOC family protein [Hoeflea sp.]MDZ7602410.1 VOC family protein [Hoeflea sp.]
MHKSRLSAIVIDVHAGHIEQAAGFWSQLLGQPAQVNDDGRQATILAAEKGVTLVIEAVADEARIHFDIETDDLAAEIHRIEQLGGRKVSVVDHTVLMEAPTGHRFRLTGPNSHLLPSSGNVWGDD